MAGKAAATIIDTHVCPMTNPNGSPHTGGKILPPGIPSVKIGGNPAATVGSSCICSGPPDTIIKGSKSVFIKGMAAARLGDSTLHGGKITSGCGTVNIGD